MLEHIKIAGLFIVVIEGALITFYLALLSKKYHYAYLRSLSYYSFLISIYVFLLLWSLYYYTNYPEGIIRRRGIMDSNIRDLLLTLISIGLIYSIISVIVSLKDLVIKSGVSRVFLLFAVMVSMLYMTRYLLPSLSGYLGWLDLIRDYFVEYIVIIEVLILLISVFIIPPGLAKDSRYLYNALAIILVCRYLIVFIFLFFVKSSQVISPELRMVSGIFSLMLAIGAPYLWVKVFFLKFARRMSKRLLNMNATEYLYARYGVSKRERQIIELIIDGKSNKEIEKELFISYHTVKNHLTHIYSKLKVKSRFELLHLFHKETI